MASVHSSLLGPDVVEGFFHKCATLDLSLVPPRTSGPSTIFGSLDLHGLPAFSTGIGVSISQTRA